MGQHAAFRAQGHMKGGVPTKGCEKTPLNLVLYFYLTLSLQPLANTLHHMAFFGP